MSEISGRSPTRDANIEVYRVLCIFGIILLHAVSGKPRPESGLEGSGRMGESLL